ncbi:uncharacterized protein LOC111025601 [Momordica charantia]|uniref:Uncharacterized protein LOC111025601 n=1 Tax=Momordica charantia TaxID=3673 RepID=A0A6J1DZ42_MOMCH|nr:uncharacterized protein LOC111025601 [Momordica charantia]
MRKNYEVNIRYEKAWRGKEVALNLLMGSSKESYTLLRKYGEALKAVNVGTIFEMELEDDKYFKYGFMALGCYIKGFSSCIRPVIVIDGAHMKGKYRGIILIASSVDGNNQIYPLAFGLGGFPNVSHGICMQHLSTNLKDKFKNDIIQENFILAVKTFQKSEFRYYFSQLVGFPEVQRYLEGIDFDKWTRAFQSGLRYDQMTSDVAESMNAVLVHARALPVTALLELHHTH